MAWFQFGENVSAYPVSVFNEREVRAAAGILFLFAMIGFVNAFLLGNFLALKIFIVAFFIDFFIRLFVNSRYSPSLTLGRLFVSNQEVEYSGAPQKRFAWIIGFVLATFMFVFLVIFNMIAPVNLIICLACLAFLFFESVFGICLGCKVYALINKEKVMLCPGGVCKMQKKEAIQKTSWKQGAVVLVLVALLIVLPFSGFIDDNSPQGRSFSQGLASQGFLSNDCEVPEWVIDSGNEDLYKEYHGCS